MLHIKEDFLIKIASRQKVGENIDQINFDTLGHYVQKNDKKYIFYKEYSANYAKKYTTSIVKIENENLITIIRNGKYASRFTLEKDKHHRCHYGTDLGPLMMGVYAEDIRVNLDNTDGNIFVKYLIDINSAIVSTNEINIKVKKINYGDKK